MYIGQDTEHNTDSQNPEPQLKMYSFFCLHDNIVECIGFLGDMFFFAFLVFSFLFLCFFFKFL